MMGFKDILYVCVIFISVILEDVLTQSGQKGKIPRTSFSCTKKPSGYYADIETGCEVYHMCDGLGRQFSYKCPNMTLFQQRMLICDHWYMVNCSMSEKDYDANLLIGQRDKPFVSDEEMGWRTPRPDTLSVPPFNPYGDILREDSKIRDVDSNDLDSKQSQNHFRPSKSFSSDNRRKDTTVKFESKSDKHKQPSFQKIELTEKQTQVRNLKNKQEIPAPNRELVPPFAPVTQATEKEVSEIVQDIEPTHSVIMFIKRFDPNSDIPETAMSKSEIIDLNAQLPDGPISSEEERSPKKHKKINSNFNTLKTQNDKSFTEGTRFDSVNTKSKPTEVPKDSSQASENNLKLERVLLPPKTEYSEFVSTTVGPPIYYEWRWAVPAFDLIPPKQSNETNSINAPQTRSVAKFEGKNPFSTVTRPEPITTTPEPFVVEYNISSYSVPDYVFPLDNPHPGYDNENAQTSFQVDVPRPGRASYGENPECPQCHPAYLEPGSCKPCIVKR